MLRDELTDEIDAGRDDEQRHDDHEGADDLKDGLAGAPGLVRAPGQPGRDGEGRRVRRVLRKHDVLGQLLHGPRLHVLLLGHVRVVLQKFEGRFSGGGREVISRSVRSEVPQPVGSPSKNVGRLKRCHALTYMMFCRYLGSTEVSSAGRLCSTPSLASWEARASCGA